MSEFQLALDRKPQENELKSLIDSAARESGVLEFKGYYMPVDDRGKHEFLKAVCAFANSHGGHLIMGMEEEAGAAKRLVAVRSGDADQCEREVQALLRAKVEPALKGVQTDVLSISGLGNVVVVRVPKSWSGPHTFTLGDSPPEFYVRDRASSRRMDYEEIRAGFLESGTTMARLRNFRSERCAAILSGDIPYRLSHSACAVLHVLPFDMFAHPRRLDVRRLFDGFLSAPVGRLISGCPHYDLDGCRIGHLDTEKATRRYAYIFLSGAVEVVDCDLTQGVPEVPLATGVPEAPLAIPQQRLEMDTASYLDAFLGLLASIEVPGPYAVFLSLLNVKGHYMPFSPRYLQLPPFTRDHVFVPERVLHSRPEAALTALRPVFDSVWNACGAAQSPNYDEQGNWSPRH